MGRINFKVGISIIVAYGIMIAVVGAYLFHMKASGNGVSQTYETEEPCVEGDMEYTEADSGVDFSEYEDIGGWKQMYLDYIADFDKVVANIITDEQKAETFIAGIRFGLVSIDDDDIPELYIEYPEYDLFQRARIITIHNGQLYDISGQRKENGEDAWSYCEYIEQSGLFLGTYDNSSYYKRVGVYAMEEGSLRVMGSGTATQVSGEQRYEWNGVGLTEEEFDSAVNAVYDRSKSVKCDQMTSLYEIEDFIIGY